MNKNEKLKKITSPHSSNWLEEAAKKLADRGVRKNARKVALRVLQILRERGISQTELAERMGVSRQQVAKIVKGQENFTFGTIDKLERALDTRLMTIGEPVEPINAMELLTAVLSVPSVYYGYATTAHWDFALPMCLKDRFVITRDASVHESHFDVPFIRDLDVLKRINLESGIGQIRNTFWCTNGKVILGTGSNESAESEEYRISDQEFSEKSMS
jgi:DNA-binding Xre family transcriptional regulator